MRYETRPIGGWGTSNNVNICININKNGETVSNDGSSDITNLQNKVASLTSDVDLLKSNVSDLSSLENFEQKLNHYFNTDEIEKIKALINTQSYDVLRNYISKFDQFNSLFEQNKQFTYKETIVTINEYDASPSSIIMAQIGLDTFVLNDVSDEDNDKDTKYKIPVQGLIIGIEFYTSSDLDSKKVSLNDVTTSYNNELKSSYLFLGDEEVENIFEKRPNNKIIIHSLIIE